MDLDSRDSHLGSNMAFNTADTMAIGAKYRPLNTVNPIEDELIYLFFRAVPIPKCLFLKEK